MADEEVPKEERIFEPTPKRKEEFRRDGRVAVSKDLASTAQLLGVVLGFVFLGNAFFAGMAGALEWVLTHVGDGGGRHLTLGDAVAAHVDALLIPTLALCAIFGGAATIAYVAQTNFLFSPKAIGFKWDRLNVIKRLADLFGPKKASVRVALAVAKVALTGAVIAMALAQLMPTIGALAFSDLEGVASVVAEEIAYLLLITVVVLAVLAALDFIWQRRQMGEQLRMTREEIKRENQDEEGRPEIKARRKQRHRELSMNRILDEVPRADVIVTNPTHFAVALRYRAGQDKAPVVTAKGVDELAANIRAIARRHGVPIIEHRPLARALFNTVKVGKPVPSSLFQAVASVLARVYRARRAPARSA